MTRTDRLTLVRQLRDEGLSQRAIAKRLNISKDTVRRDIERLTPAAEPDEASAGEPGAHDAPQASGASGERAAPADAPQDAPARELPRRVAQPLGGVDLSQWPAVRRDLAVLAQTGRTAEAMAHQAIAALAHHYRQALARGDIQPGTPFIVSAMTLRPVAPRVLEDA